MKATESRKIAENDDKALEDILFGIKAMSESAKFYSAFNSNDMHYNESIKKKLKDLGYKVENKGDGHIRITW